MKFIEITLENLSVRYTKFTYDFTPRCCLTPKSSPLTGLEMALFVVASKHGLTLSRVHSKGKIARVYRIADDHSFVDFLLSEEGIKVQKVSVSREDEDFLINKFAKVVFECGSEWIAGVASNDAELARFARCGFATNPQSKTFALMAPQTLSE
jgi:hypothetical protein